MAIVPTPVVGRLPAGSSSFKVLADPAAPLTLNPNFTTSATSQSPAPPPPRGLGLQRLVPEVTLALVPHGGRGDVEIQIGASIGLQRLSTSALKRFHALHSTRPLQG